MVTVIRREVMVMVILSAGPILHDVYQVMVMVI